MGILSKIFEQGKPVRPDDESARFRALIGKRVVADSDDTTAVEARRYFPRKDVDPTMLESNPRQTTCPWKGVASYQDIVIEEHRWTAAVWYYAEPKAAAAHILDHVAFDNAVDVVPVPG